MRVTEDPVDLKAALYNAGWWVRRYPRGIRSNIGKLERQQAILAMGLAVREAFNNSDDFEGLLTTVVDALSPKDDPPF